MKIASVLMTLVFAGVVAHANETAPAAATTVPAAPAATEMKKEDAKHSMKKHAKKAKGEKKEEAAAPATH